MSARFQSTLFVCGKGKMMREILKLKKKQNSLAYVEDKVACVRQFNVRAGQLVCEFSRSKTLRRSLSKVLVITSSFTVSKHSQVGKPAWNFSILDRERACTLTATSCALESPWGQLSFLFLWLFPAKRCSQVCLPSRTAQSVYVPFLDYCK